MIIVDILKKVMTIFMLTLFRKKKFTLLNSWDKQYLQHFCGKSLSKNYPFFCLILQQQQNQMWPVHKCHQWSNGAITGDRNGQSTPHVFEADAQRTYSLENVDVLTLTKKEEAESWN